MSAQREGTRFLALAWHWSWGFKDAFSPPDDSVVALLDCTRNQGSDVVPATHLGEATLIIE